MARSISFCGMVLLKWRVAPLATMENADNVVKENLGLPHLRKNCLTCLIVSQRSGACF